MIVKRGRGDLNKIYRPCKIEEVAGQTTIKRMIKNALENGTLPHSLLFTGPSGCGKTTFARLIALGLNCVNGPTASPCCVCDSCKSILNLNSFAVIELDSARTSDVGTVRRTLDDLPAAPMGGERFRVLIVDEAHQLSGKAEDALLKFLEDVPEHVYIILCTNEPQQLKLVTRNRCKAVQFGRLTDGEVTSILVQVSQFEGYDYKNDVLKYIAEEAGGVPRAALSFLQQVASEGSWTKEAASLIINAGADIDQADILDFCRHLVKGGGFKNAVELIKKIKQIPPESMRITMCGFFVGCLKNARSTEEADKFSTIVDIMSVPIYNIPKAEHVIINNVYKIVKILKG